MKGYLKAILATNYVWLLVVFLVLFLAAVPAIPGSLLVKLPGPGDWTSSESGGIVNLTANVSIYNGGFFPLDNFYFVVALYSNNGSLMARFESQKVSLPPGPWTTFPVYFLFNESTTTSSQVQAMFFSTVDYRGLIYFNAEYLLDFRFEMGVNATASVGPLVRDFRPDVGNATVQQVGEYYLMDIPYAINTSQALSGSRLFMNGTVCNATRLLGAFETEASMGASGGGNMTVVLTEEAYLHLRSSSDTLVLNCSFTFARFQWDQEFTVEWTPPQGWDALPPEGGGPTALAPRGR
jgi:hypothetical protein